MVKYLTDEELLSFFTYLDECQSLAKSNYKERLAIRNKAIFKIMYYTGLRATELCELRTVYYTPKHHKLYCPRKKGGYSNTIQFLAGDPEPPEGFGALEALEQHLRINQPQQYLFTPLQGRDVPISRKMLDKRIKQCFQAAGIINEKAHCHALRHTRAIHLAELGFNDREIQWWLGHADVRNTMIYLSFTSKQQEHLYRKLQGRGNDL